MNEKKKIIMTREVILELPKYREQGLTNYEIAKNLGVSAGTIKYWFKRLVEDGHKVPRRLYRGGIKTIIL